MPTPSLHPNCFRHSSLGPPITDMITDLRLYFRHSFAIWTAKTSKFYLWKCLTCSILPSKEVKMK